MNNREQATWIEVYDSSSSPFDLETKYKCSYCGHISYMIKTTPFCPYCGCSMVDSEEDVSNQ